MGPMQTSSIGGLPADHWIHKAIAREAQRVGKKGAAQKPGSGPAEQKADPLLAAKAPAPAAVPGGMGPVPPGAPTLSQPPQQAAPVAKVEIGPVGGKPSPAAKKSASAPKSPPVKGGGEKGPPRPAPKGKNYGF